VERGSKEEGFPDGEEGEVVCVALLDVGGVRLNERPGEGLGEAWREGGREGGREGWVGGSTLK